MTDRYTHDPDAFDEGETDDATAERAGESASGAEPTENVQGKNPRAVDREFDWRGWTLVAGTFVAFLLVPGIVYLYPRIPSAFGLSFWDTYLALPLVPALVLGLLAVWATTRP